MTQSNYSNPDKHHGGARTVTEEKLMVNNISLLDDEVENLNRLADMILIAK